jgi:DNA invertase Pin-like site-specific DNA recombinase/flagellar biosynthesis chaperone FliJ
VYRGGTCSQGDTAALGGRETMRGTEYAKSGSWWALYIRLSREDGDRAESLSVAHQKMKLVSYVQKIEDNGNYELYIDDGWTGTNFDRPQFQRMIKDIEEHRIIGVIVKDLSRLGRESSKTGFYVQEYFPEHRVRFIAIDDNVDKNYYDFNTSEDMMIDFKNMFNGFYPRDISNKVRSTLKTKQQAGKFIGAFPCYGYRKAPNDHNQLIIDEPAAAVVRRIFHLYLSGDGQNTIAKMLNEEGVPCPTEYKKLQGEKYYNANKLTTTTYWTYSSIRNILRNETYTGAMVQNKSFRQACKKKAIQLPRDKWIIVPDSHEAVIEKEVFEKTQFLLSQNTKPTRLSDNVHIFAGLLKCGDCERAMCRITRKRAQAFCCGSFNRYGTSHCSSHYIQCSVLEELVRNDFNALLAHMQNLKDIILDEEKKHASQVRQVQSDTEILTQEIQKLEEKKARAYEDYADGLITKADFARYNEGYETKIAQLEDRIDCLNASKEGRDNTTRNAWIARLLEIGHVDKLDRSLVVEMVGHIYIYQDNTIKIIYNFSDELADLLEGQDI